MTAMQQSINDFKCEDNQSSRTMQGKRMLANVETCKIELKKEIQLLFQTFAETLNKTNNALSMFPPLSRSRTLEASIIQSFFAENLFKNFENKAFLGKYKRIILRANGYLILFKKLNNKGYPMNIKTVNVQSMLNQNQQLDLFAETNYSYDPILYFGYQKNKFGNFINPQLIYIDEGIIQFSINELDFQIQLPTVNLEVNEIVEVKLKLKNNQVLKKAN
jgi:hypothetical protein